MSMATAARISALEKDVDRLRESIVSLHTAERPTDMINLIHGINERLQSLERWQRKMRTGKLRDDDGK